MDHYMPRMDGIEAVKILREYGYTRPIVALTANAIAGQAEVFMENGFDGFISKPVDIRQLNIVLNKLVRDVYPPDIVEAARRLELKVNMEKSAAKEASPAATDPELAAIFVRDAEKAIARLEATRAHSYRRTDDIKLYVFDIHAMKSALANIGETELSAAAHRLEKAGRAEDVSVIMSETPAFLDALREVIGKNKPKKNDDGMTEEESPQIQAYLAEKLLAIQKACEEYDEKKAAAALAELKQKKLPNSTRELLDTIAGHLLHSDFEEAASLAKDYAKNKEARQAQ